MAALAVISKKGQLKDYYDRKVEQGKNKMSVINAVRNKLIHRVFACVRDNRNRVAGRYEISSNRSYSIPINCGWNCLSN